jgi:hypothetical protein
VIADAVSGLWAGRTSVNAQQHLIAARLVAEHITPQLATSTASLTGNVANSCRTSYTTQICDYQVHIRQSCVAQTGSTGKLGVYRMVRTSRQLGAPRKHQGSIIRYSRQHSETRWHATVSSQPGQLPCPSISKPSHSSHVQASRLALVYTICSSALLLCASCTEKYPMCQRYMLPLKNVEEQLHPCKVAISDGGRPLAPIVATAIGHVMYRRVRYRSFFPVQGADSDK